MSWRWRKIINLGGGIRANFSRAGIGWSWGVPGFRIGKGADNSTWISIGIPGTGLYFTKRLSANTQKTTRAPQIDDKEFEDKHKPEIKKWKDLK